MISKDQDIQTLKPSVPSCAFKKTLIGPSCMFKDSFWIPYDPLNRTHTKPIWAFKENPEWDWSWVQMVISNPQSLFKRWKAASLLSSRWEVLFCSPSYRTLHVVNVSFQSLMEAICDTSSSLFCSSSSRCLILCAAWAGRAETSAVTCPPRWDAESAGDSLSLLCFS